MGTDYVATQAIQSMSEYEAIVCHFATNIYLECSSHELCQGFESRLKFIIIYKLLGFWSWKRFLLVFVCYFRRRIRTFDWRPFKAFIGVQLSQLKTG